MTQAWLATRFLAAAVHRGRRQRMSPTWLGEATKDKFVVKAETESFRLREPFERVCHCEVNIRPMDLWMTPLYSYAHGEHILMHNSPIAEILIQALATLLMSIHAQVPQE